MKVDIWSLYNSDAFLDGDLSAEPLSQVNPNAPIYAKFSPQQIVSHENTADMEAAVLTSTQDSEGQGDESHNGSSSFTANSGPQAGVPVSSLLPSETVERLRAEGAEFQLEWAGDAEDPQGAALLTVLAPRTLHDEGLSELRKAELTASGEGYTQAKIGLTPLNAFILRYVMRGVTKVVPQDMKSVLSDLADKVPTARGILSEDGKHVELTLPNLEGYRSIAKKLGAYPRGDKQLVQIGRVLDLEGFIEQHESAVFPKIALSKDVLAVTRDPIPGFDGTLESLRHIPLSTLNVIAANTQTATARSKSKKSLAEKLANMGMESLYDLLLWYPRRHIDKSNPGDLEGLSVGETAVVLGKIASIGSLPGKRPGAVFAIDTGGKYQVRTTFFNQSWLAHKFSVGQEVLVTGKLGFFAGRPQVSGASIEFAEEAAALPVVPVYNQSPSAGITTKLILSAMRELFARTGEKIALPEYFTAMQPEGDTTTVDYGAAMHELHFPTPGGGVDAVDMLAYYEMVYLQVLVGLGLEKSADVGGLAFGGDANERGETHLQQAARAALPFELTGEQNRAVAELNELLSSDTPAQVLLNADTGSGKTLVAQMAVLRTVDAGYQAALIAPTEVLAQQLYANTVRLFADLTKSDGSEIRVEYISGAMPARDRKAALKRLAAGEVDVAVGTHALVSSTTEYANLGFAVIDEQQKFGAEQRTALLDKRTDGKIPHLLTQTATPIPRSIAQVFYGGITMIELSERPAGRIPIETVWIEEEPRELVTQLTNEIMQDVLNEAEQGNQTFIITPMVQESDKIDAASVKHTYDELHKGALASVRVGLVHGQMKQPEQAEIMRQFRDKELDVLVASTVVEVGVDIPDATRVIVLSADRMGGASLHQIRGRVGRNSKPSKCYLVAMTENDTTRKRLQALVDSENGFDIAKVDLELRGEGQLFGTTQSGKTTMRFASMVRSANTIAAAKRMLGRYLIQRLETKRLKMHSSH